MWSFVLGILCAPEYDILPHNIIGDQSTLVFVATKYRHTGRLWKETHSNSCLLQMFGLGAE